MKNKISVFIGTFLLLVFGLLGYGSIKASDRQENFLRPQSSRSTGEKRVLMVAVRFPDAQPTKTLEEVKRRAMFGLDNYYEGAILWSRMDKGGFQGMGHAPRLPFSVSGESLQF